MRENLIARHPGDGRELFPGIIGYDDTVVPQLVNAILVAPRLHPARAARPGEDAHPARLTALPRRVACRSVAGCEINDDPFSPVCQRCQRPGSAELGDELPIEWLHREDALPARSWPRPTSPSPTSSATSTRSRRPPRSSPSPTRRSIHFGIIPRTNRGIFAINELPDLQPRIQVGLLQHHARRRTSRSAASPCASRSTCCMVFTANPEDYTNRGNIITPLQGPDRLPDHHALPAHDRGRPCAITAQEAWLDARRRRAVEVPDYFREIIEQVAVRGAGERVRRPDVGRERPPDDRR